MMIHSKFRITLALLTAALFLCVSAASAQDSETSVETQANSEKSMQVQFLEIVTSDVDATCDVLAKVHGVTFGAPEALLGNARTAALENGGQISVRAPMAEHEHPVVRPYLLVDDIEAALGAAEAAGGEIAMAATELPGIGTFAIYILGGIQHGLWLREPTAD